MILYHSKIFIIMYLLPSKLPIRQKGCTNAADGVKNRSIVLRCRDGGDWQSRWITVGISVTELLVGQFTDGTKRQTWIFHIELVIEW